MSTSEKVLQAIKKLRTDNGYRLSDVAQGIGYETTKGYYDLESGKTDIKLDHLDRLSQFYKIPLEFFLSLESTEMVQNHPESVTPS